RACGGPGHPDPANRRAGDARLLAQGVASAKAHASALRGLEREILDREERLLLDEARAGPRAVRRHGLIEDRRDDVIGTRLLALGMDEDLDGTKADVILRAHDELDATSLLDGDLIGR